MSQRYQSLEEVIEANGLDKDCPMSAEAIIRHAKMAMVTDSFAYVLADAAETFLMDCECSLSKFDRYLRKETKQNFKHMHQCVRSAHAAAKKAVSDMYKTNTGFTDDACIDSDWWYNFIKLVDDRVGTNQQKTMMLLEFLLNMPSEGEGLFNPKLEDFVNE